MAGIKEKTVEEIHSALQSLLEDLKTKGFEIEYGCQTVSPNPAGFESMDATHEAWGADGSVSIEWDKKEQCWLVIPSPYLDAEQVEMFFPNC